MAKITLIGAGGYSFGRDLITDIVSFPELRDSTLALMDIDKERLDLTAAFAKKLVEQHGFNTKVESTTNRSEALAGADYVIVSIRAGGWAPFLANRKVSLKYGVEAMPDALGTGGIFAALRQITAILDICHDMEKICEDALLINYSNPVAMIGWAINDYTHIKNVGQCPNPHQVINKFAGYIGALENEIFFSVAGINHFSWYLEFKWRGKDAYPLLREKFSDLDILRNTLFSEGIRGGHLQLDIVDLLEVEMLKRFGYVTSGGGHIQMFLPYFRKQPDLLERYRLPGFSYLDEAPKTASDDIDKVRQQLCSNYQFPLISEHGASRYAVEIINSIETGTTLRTFANVRNSGLITNLLEGCVVEVPCMVDKAGIHPCYVGDIPPQCAALNSSNVFVQELAVRGIVEKDKNKILQSLLLDPLTSATLTIDEIATMADEMFEIDKEYLKGFK
jgi:alpha-galactosidase